MSIGRGQREVCDLVRTAAQILRAAYPNCNQLLAEPDMGGDAAADQGFDLAGDLVGLQPLLRSQTMVDLDRNGIASDPQAVNDLDDAGNVRQRLADTPGGCFQRCGIVP